MFCKICGSNMKDGERFCNICGWDSFSDSNWKASNGGYSPFSSQPSKNSQPLSEPQSVQNQQTPYASQPVYTPAQSYVNSAPQKKNTNVLLVVAIVFAVAALGIGGYFIIDKIIDNNEPKHAVIEINGHDESRVSSTESNKDDDDSYKKTGEYNRGGKTLLRDTYGGSVSIVSDEDAVVSSGCREDILDIALRLTRYGGLDCAVRIIDSWHSIETDYMMDGIGYDNIEIIVSPNGNTQVYAAGYGEATLDSDTLNRAMDAGALAAQRFSDKDAIIYNAVSEVAEVLADPLSEAKEKILPYYYDGNQRNSVMYVFDVGSSGLFVRSSPEKIGGKKDANNNLICYSDNGKPVYLEDDESVYVFFTYGQWAYIEVLKRGEIIRGWSSLDYLTSVIPS